MKLGRAPTTCSIFFARVSDIASVASGYQGIIQGCRGRSPRMGSGGVHQIAYPPFSCRRRGTKGDEVYAINVPGFRWRDTSRVMKNSFAHPPVPLPGQEGGGNRFGGYPQTPTPSASLRASSGASPLWTPLFQQPARQWCVTGRHCCYIQCLRLNVAGFG